MAVRNSAWRDRHGANVRGLAGIGDRWRMAGPMPSGLLTGKFSHERVESRPEDDWGDPRTSPWRPAMSPQLTQDDLDEVAADSSARAPVRAGRPPPHPLAVLSAAGFGNRRQA
jgi:hypothetical protein